MKDVRCSLCESDLFELQILDIDYIEFHRILPSNTMHHVHKANIYYQSTRKPQKVIFKRTMRSHELKILKMLQELFKGHSKPHMSLLAFVEDKQSNATVMMLERGKIDLHGFRIQTDGLISSSISTAIVRSLVEKVSMLHKNDLAHLDLSIENVLLTNKEVFLIDFENARLLPHEEEFHFNTDTKPMCNAGKENFMSSEQHSGRAWNGFQSDVFAIGIIAFWLFFGTLPFNSHKSRECKWLQTNQVEEVVLWFGSPFSDDLYTKQTRLALQFIAQCCSHASVRPRHAEALLAHELFTIKK